jgi:3-oxoacyl-[acyl-carrier protein] reductase
MAARKNGVIINIVGAAAENPDFDYVVGSSGNVSLMVHSGDRRVGRHATGCASWASSRAGHDRPACQSMRTRTQARWTEFTKPLAFGRAAKREEIAWLAAFLASERSGYTTGSIVTIDGGGSSRRSPLRPLPPALSAPKTRRRGRSQ